MKKVITVVGLAAVFASPAVLADYEFYGKAHVGILNTDADHADGSSDSTTDLESFASRIGVKGKTEINEGLDAIYQWEAEVDLTGDNTEGDDGLLKARNQFVGLKGSFGSVIGGIHDTPMKQAEGKIDLFSDVFDMARTQDPYMDTQEREKHFLGYYSPHFSNMQFQLGTTKGAGKEFGDAFSTALVYGDSKLKKSNFFAALAYDKGIDTDKDATAVRVSGQTKFGAATVGAIVEQADTGLTGADSQTRYVLSGTYKLAGNNALLLQYAKSDDANNGSKDIAGSSDLTLGLSHKLGKDTSVYGAINKGESMGGVKNEDETNIVVGITHKFKL